MKKFPVTIISCGVSFVVSQLVSLGTMLSSAHAAVHMHGMNHSNTQQVKECVNATYKQQCAKTMTSTFDKTGRLWSAWTNGDFLYVNFSDDKGITFSTPVRVNAVAENISARNENRPKIKVAKNSNVYLSWTQKLKKRFTGNIRFSRSIDNGRSFTKPITVNDNHDLIGHRFDTLGVNKKGDIYISWLDKRDKQRAKLKGKTYNGAAAYFALSTDNGSSFLANKKLADTSCECCRMAMAFDKRGLPVIAWRHIYGDNIRDHAIVNFKSRQEPSQPNRLSQDNWQINGCPHHGPSLSISDDNTYHAVWFNNAEKRHGIFYAKSVDAGQHFGRSMPVGSYTNRASHADIVSFNNVIYVVWQEFNSSHYQLYMMKSVTNGDTWDKPVIVSSASKMPDYPFVITDGKNVYASWHQQGKKYKPILLK